MPWGTKQPTKRGLGVAAVWASAVEAGIIASRSGSARVAPAPRRTVRREMCFLVMNICIPLLLFLLTGSPLLRSGRTGGLHCLHVGLEWGALHDPHHY